MYFSLKKHKKYIKKQLNNLSIKKLKAILNRKRLKFSKKEILLYLLAVLEFRKNLVPFKEIYKKYKKKYKYKLLYSTFMQNIKVVSPIFKFFFEEENRKYNKNIETLRKEDELLEIEILDSSLLPAIKNSSRKYEKHLLDTTKRNGNLITGWKIYTKINLKGRITHLSKTNIRKNDLTYLKENKNLLIQGVKKLLTDSGFSSKAFKKELNKDLDEFKIISPIRLANKERKGNSFEDFTEEDFELYKSRYFIERNYRFLKHHRGQIKLEINFLLSEAINLALIYSSCWEYNQFYT